MDVFALLIGVILICLVVWAVRSLCAAFGLGEPLSTVLMVLVVFLVVFAILGWIGVGANIGHLRLGR